MQKIMKRRHKIIAASWKIGMHVTIATNMAGRGTDIQLGGNTEGFALSLTAKKK